MTKIWLIERLLFQYSIYSLKPAIMDGFYFYFIYFLIIDHAARAPCISALRACTLLFNTINVYLIYSESNLFTTVQIAAVLLASCS